MIVLLDSNILLRLDHVGHPHRAKAQAAIERLIDEQYIIRTVPQVLYEYWVVATRRAESIGIVASVWCVTCVADTDPVDGYSRSRRGK